MKVFSLATLISLAMALSIPDSTLEEGFSLKKREVQGDAMQKVLSSDVPSNPVKQEKRLDIMHGGTVQGIDGDDQKRYSKRSDPIETLKPTAKQVKRADSVVSNQADKERVMALTSEYQNMIIKLLNEIKLDILRVFEIRSESQKISQNLLLGEKAEGKREVVFALSKMSGAYSDLRATVLSVCYKEQFQPDFCPVFISDEYFERAKKFKLYFLKFLERLGNNPAQVLEDASYLKNIYEAQVREFEKLKAVKTTLWVDGARERSRGQLRLALEAKEKVDALFKEHNIV